MELICAQGNWPVLYMGRSATYIALVCHDACSAGRLVQRKQRMMTLKRLSPARLTPLPNVTVQRSIVAQHTSRKRGFIAGATPTARAMKQTILAEPTQRRLNKVARMHPKYPVCGTVLGLEDRLRSSAAVVFILSRRSSIAYRRTHPRKKYDAEQHRQLRWAALRLPILDNKGDEAACHKDLVDTPKNAGFTAADSGESIGLS